MAIQLGDADPRKTICNGGMELVREVAQQGRLAVLVRQLYELLWARAVIGDRARDKVLPAVACHAADSTLAHSESGVSNSGESMQRNEDQAGPMRPTQAEAHETAQRWAISNTFSVEELDRSSAERISVVIPAREVAETIAGVVAPCAALLEAGAIAELFVVDANSGDGTAALAQQFGATVLQEARLLPEHGPVVGKGDAMWRSLSVVTGDIVVFVDGDTSGFNSDFITGLAGPLLGHSELQMVKGAFSRPFIDGQLRVENGGGRVNELVARPLLNIYFPELSAVDQPLAGEFAARTEALRALPFRTGYGVEIQLLIDIYRQHGLAAIGQTDLGERLNAHQSLQALGPMAYAVARTLLERAGAEIDAGSAFLGYRDAELAVREVELFDRPPMHSVLPKSTARISSGS